MQTRPHKHSVVVSKPLHRTSRPVQIDHPHTCAQTTSYEHRNQSPPNFPSCRTTPPQQSPTLSANTSHPRAPICAHARPPTGRPTPPSSRLYPTLRSEPSRARCTTYGPVCVGKCRCVSQCAVHPWTTGHFRACCCPGGRLLQPAATHALGSAPPAAHRTRGCCDETVAH